jgi:hypothetical protein
MLFLTPRAQNKKAGSSASVWFTFCGSMNPRPNVFRPFDPGHARKLSRPHGRGVSLTSRSSGEALTPQTTALGDRSLVGCRQPSWTNRRSGIVC